MSPLFSHNCFLSQLMREDKRIVKGKMQLLRREERKFTHETECVLRSFLKLLLLSILLPLQLLLLYLWPEESHVCHRISFSSSWVIQTDWGSLTVTLDPGAGAGVQCNREKRQWEKIYEKKDALITMINMLAIIIRKMQGWEGKMAGISWEEEVKCWLGLAAVLMCA